MKTLAEMRDGEEGIVINIVGGRGAIRNLIGLGIYPGTRIKVLGRIGGAMLVSINGSKFAIGRGLAMKVIVSDRKKI